MKYGDLVSYELPDHPASGVGYIIGIPTYSDGYDQVVMLANEDPNEECIGMVINACWLRLLLDERRLIADRLRARWDAEHPGFLHPIEPKSNPIPTSIKEQP